MLHEEKVALHKTRDAKSFRTSMVAKKEFALQNGVCMDYYANQMIE